MRLAAVLAALLLFAGGARAETVLRARLNADIVSTMPGMKRDENTDALLLHIVEGLVASREDGSVGPMLAKSWTVSPDGKTYRFALRDGVRFHNGAPLTAADVVWSFQWYLKPGNHWRCLPSFRDTALGKILDVRAPDAHTVTLALSRPMPLLLKTLARADCGGTGILHHDSVAADGGWKKPIGTGPFMMGAWKHGEYVELLRYPGYASLPGPRDGNGGGKKALVDRIRFLIIPDAAAAVAALMRGSIDLMDAIDPNMQATVRSAPHIRMADFPTTDFWCVMLQVQDPVLKDVRLRQAIALTLDVSGIARAATAGTALPDSSPVPVVSPYYKGALARLVAQDIAKARRLVADSGYRGQPITLVTNRRYPQMFDVAVLVQAMARQAGINFQIQTLDWATQLSLYSRGAYQAMVFGFSAKSDASLNFDLLIGNKKKDPRKVWDSAAAIALHQQSLATPDGPARQAVFDQLNAAFLKDAPAVILFNSRRVSAARDTVTGYKGWPAAQQRLWNVGLKPSGSGG